LIISSGADKTDEADVFKTLFKRIFSPNIQADLQFKRSGGFAIRLP